MSMRLGLAAAATVLVSAVALAQEAPPPAEPPAQLKALADSCAAHRFETTVDLVVEGLPKKSKVKICGQEGQSDADWLRTLRDSADKVAGNAKMPESVKAQILAALNAEIARLAPPVTIGPSTSFTLTPRPVIAAPPSSVARDYAALPPLPTRPSVEPPHLLPGGPGAATLPRPRLSLQCFTPGDAGAVPCADFARDTLVTVRAGEDLPPGTSLRFVRGEARAEVQLAQLRSGKSLRFALPGEVCRGVGGGKLDVEILRTAKAGALGQVVGSEGPFNLRC